MQKWYRLLRSKRGDGMLIQATTFILVGVVLMVLGLDFYSFYQQNVYMKEVLNRGVKAAAMQVDREATHGVGEEALNLYASGIFLIDKPKAEQAFRSILVGNLIPEGSNLSLGDKVKIEEFEVIQSYIALPDGKLQEMGETKHFSPLLNQEYAVKHPSVFVVCKYEIRSVFLKKEIRFAKLSSAELVNVG